MPPDKLSDTLFGDVFLSHRFTDKHAEYEACAGVWDRQVKVIIYSDPDTGETNSAMSRARSIVEHFGQHKRALLVHLDREFLPRFRENSGVVCSSDDLFGDCLLYTSPSPRDRTRPRMPSSA